MLIFEYVISSFYKLVGVSFSRLYRRLLGYFFIVGLCGEERRGGWRGGLRCDGEGF